MLSNYVKISEICLYPNLYNQKCVQSTARIKNRPFFSSSNKSSQFIIELNSTTKVDLIISIWKEPPSWLPYSTTSERLWELFESKNEMKNLFLPGEDLFFEGFVIKQKDTIWINVEKIIILSPSTVVGSREIISYLTCERKYYLDYVKNVKHNILSYPNKYITRGSIVHRLIEKILVEGIYFELFTLSEEEKSRKLKEIIKNLVDSEYLLDSVLHCIISNSIDSMLHDVFQHTIGLISDTEVYEFFSTKKIQTEVQLNNTFGFYGIMDFLVDDIPIEFKSSAHISEEHKIQLKVYLLNTYLNKGTRNGYLLYSLPIKTGSDSISCRLYSVVLEDKDIGELLYARHSILLQRRGTYLPTTYNRECLECKYKEYSDNSLQHYLPICQFYCQTERYWECFPVEDTGEIGNKCLLFLIGSCPLNENYFDINTIDFFNETRKVIQIENEMQHMVKILLNNASPESLELCGQRINNLKYIGKSGTILTFKRDITLPQLDLLNGDFVSLKTEDGKFSCRGSVKRLGLMDLEVDIEGNLEGQFFSYDSYNLIKEYSEMKFLRYLLGVIDYVQRSKHDVELIFPKDGVISRRNIPIYDPEEVTKVVLSKKVIGIQVPFRSSLVDILMDIIPRLQAFGKILVVFNSESDIKKYIEQCQEPYKFLVLNKVINFSEDPKPWEIGAQDNSDIIVEKIMHSEIILTNYNFIFENHFFELLHVNNKKKFFDLLILTRAEIAFDPLFFYFRSLAEKVLMFGDAESINYPFKSNEARGSLRTGIFEKLVKNYSYFESKSYSVFCQPFNQLPEQVVKILTNTKMDILVCSYGGEVIFVNVHGVEKTVTSINYGYSVSMKPSSIKYRLDLKSKGNCEIYKLSEKLGELSGKDIDSYERSKIISLGGDYFEISRISAEGKNHENIEHNVRIYVSFYADSVKQLSELMYYNEIEAYEVVNLIKTIRSRNSLVIVTPFLSQVSLIRSIMFKEGIIDVPVLLPYQLVGKNYDVAIVSFVNSNIENLIRWPLSDLKLLYMILTSANEKLFLIGDKRTLCRNRILKEIIESPNTVHLQG